MDKLNAYIEATGISGVELANRLGTSEATVSRLRKGLQKPSLALLERLAWATKGLVTPNDFIAPRPPVASQEASRL